jgi:hypothetical protein
MRVRNQQNFVRGATLLAQNGVIVDIIYFLVQINDDDGSVQIRHSK